MGATEDRHACNEVKKEIHKKDAASNGNSVVAVSDIREP